jgi:hypothetical protein
MMKRLILPFLTMVLAVSVLSGCAGSNDTSAGLMDQSVSQDQLKAKQACYKAQEQVKPDMSSWTPEQISQYELIQKLGDSNKLLAKVSLDPCADAGGTNVYDARIAQIKEGTKRQKNWMDFGLGVATKTLYGFIAYEAADSYKTWVKRNDGDDDLPASLEDEEFADDVVLDPISEDTPVITPLEPTAPLE